MINSREFLGMFSQLPVLTIILCIIILSIITYMYYQKNYYGTHNQNL